MTRRPRPASADTSGSSSATCAGASSNAASGPRIDRLLDEHAGCRLNTRRDHLADQILTLPQSRDYLAIKVRYAAGAWQQRTHARAAWHVAVRDITVHLRNGEDWIAQTLRWAERGCPNWQTSAWLCDHVARIARTLGHSVLSHVGVSDLALADTATTRGRALHHLYLSALRRDLRFGQLETLLTHASAQRSWDPYAQSCHAAGLLGQDRPDATFAADQARLEADADPTCLHALLHGLYHAFALPSRAELILKIVEAAPFNTGPDPVVELRRSRALRTLGRFHDALAAINRGLTALEPEEFHTHADLVAERGLILCDQQRAAERASRR